MKKLPFSTDLFKQIDIESIYTQIKSKLEEDVFNVLRRKGGIIGISGGIDSSVTLALAAKALGSENVIGIRMPEKDSSSDSLVLAEKLAKKFSVKMLTETVGEALEGFGCYRRRDEAVKRVFPEYTPEKYKMKIVIKQKSSISNLPPLFSVVIIDENGNEKSKLLPAREYMQIVAASNFKQRSRMSMLYYHAEANHYAAIGTPNKHETEQGFFVKYGDGGADCMPIGNLYKTQVYQLAEYLGVPQEIIDRTPTTDTYSAEQTQEEFFYQLPFETMDLLWYGFENEYPCEEVAEAMEMTPQEVKNIFSNFERKRLTTEYLRMSPIRDY